MGPEQRISCDGLREMAEDVIAAMGEKSLEVDLDLLDRYCRLTGHDFSRCRESGRMPAGFFMTFVDPIVTEFFIRLLGARPGVIKGGIHTRSKVELFAPLEIGAGPFRERIEIKAVEEKKGEKGDYLAANFEVVLMDGEGAKTALDHRQFFFRI